MDVGLDVGIEASTAKRKLASQSPERESSSTTSTLIEVTENGHKRRDTSGKGLSAFIAPGPTPSLASALEASVVASVVENNVPTHPAYQMTHNADGVPFYDLRLGLPELEVEEQIITLTNPQHTSIKLKVFLQKDYTNLDVWMDTLVVKATHESQDIGTAYGLYIKRDLIRSRFWSFMKMANPELWALTTTLFDRYGRLKRELISHEFRKGGGTWGSELDLGDFFFVDLILLDRTWRRMGLGKAMVSLLIDKAKRGGREPDFVLSSPGWLNMDVALEEDLEGKTRLEQQEFRHGTEEKAVAFFRSLGFRRIGCTHSFGLSTDPEHKSHQVLSTDDWNAPSTEAEEAYILEVEDDNTPTLLAKNRRLELLGKQLPLHHAAIVLKDSECVKFFAKFESENPGADWTTVDRDGGNILHFTAAEWKPQSVQWILANKSELQFAKTPSGDTPLESLERELECRGSWTPEHGPSRIILFDSFAGYSEAAVQCLALLRGIDNPTSIQVLRIKFGCTCSQCIDGFLSPRMKFALLCETEFSSETLDLFVEDGERWCAMHRNMICFVAPDIQANFRTNKSYRQGFRNLFCHIAVALRTENAPTISNIVDAWQGHNEWPPHTRNFLRRGGSIASALRVVFRNAMDEDEWAGDGSHKAVFVKDIDALPKCRNDHEFGFVARTCGLPNLQV